MKPARTFPFEALAPFAAVFVALVAGGVLIALLGQSPFEVYALLLQQALGTGYGVGQTLFKATPLVFAGLSVALAFRAGLFNVGAEGQMYLGGFAAALVGAYVPLPPLLLLPASLVAAGAWLTASVCMERIRPSSGSRTAFAPARPRRSGGWARAARSCCDTAWCWI